MTKINFDGEIELTAAKKVDTPATGNATIFAKNGELWQKKDDGEESEVGAEIVSGDGISITKTEDGKSKVDISVADGGGLKFTSNGKLATSESRETLTLYNSGHTLDARPGTQYIGGFFDRVVPTPLIRVPNVDSIVFDSTFYYIIPDGTKMFFLSHNPDCLVQVDLETPWDIQSRTNAITFPISEIQYARELLFNENGKQMWYRYYNSSTAEKVYAEITFETPWDISTAATERLVPFDFSFDVARTFFAASGTRYFEYIDGNLRGWALSTPYDMATTSALKSISSQEFKDYGIDTIFFREDGMAGIAISMTTHNIYNFTCDSPHDISTAAMTTWIDCQLGAILMGHETQVTSDGTKIYKCLKRNGICLGMSTPWDITTLEQVPTSPKRGFFLEYGSSLPSGAVITPDGDYAYFLDAPTQGMRRTKLNTPWDVTTAELDMEYSVRNIFPWMSIPSSYDDYEICMSLDGLHFTVIDKYYNHDNLYTTYGMDAPYDFASAVEVAVDPYYPQDYFPDDIHWEEQSKSVYFSPDGKKMFCAMVSDITGGCIGSFDLAIPWSISSYIPETLQTMGGFGEYYYIAGIAMADDGKKIYVHSESDGDNIVDLPTAYDLTGGSIIASGDSLSHKIFANSDGTKFIVCNGDSMDGYHVDTAWTVPGGTSDGSAYYDEDYGYATSCTHMLCTRALSTIQPNYCYVLYIKANDVTGSPWIIRRYAMKYVDSLYDMSIDGDDFTFEQDGAYGRPLAITVSETGNRIAVVAESGCWILETTVPYDFSNATIRNQASFVYQSISYGYDAACFSTNGYSIGLMQFNNKYCVRYSLPVAFDVASLGTRTELTLPNVKVFSEAAKYFTGHNDIRYGIAISDLLFWRYGYDETMREGSLVDQSLFPYGFNPYYMGGSYERFPDADYNQGTLRAPANIVMYPYPNGDFETGQYNVTERSVIERDSGKKQIVSLNDQQFVEGNDIIVTAKSVRDPEIIVGETWGMLVPNGCIITLDGNVLQAQHLASSDASFSLTKDASGIYVMNIISGNLGMGTSSMPYLVRDKTAISSPFISIDSPVASPGTFHLPYLAITSYADASSTIKYYEIMFLVEPYGFTNSPLCFNLNTTADNRSLWKTNWACVSTNMSTGTITATKGTAVPMPIIDITNTQVTAPTYATGKIKVWANVSRLTSPINYLSRIMFESEAHSLTTPASNVFVTTKTVGSIVAQSSVVLKSSDDFFFCTSTGGTSVPSIKYAITENVINKFFGN
jgi:hypothetical protein